MVRARDDNRCESYRQMIRRCNNKNSKDYKRYGGRDTHTKYVTKDGESLNSFAKRNGIHRAVIYDRLRRGWTIEEIVNTPVGQKRKLKK